MKQSTHPTGYGKEESPVAYHIRRRRQWYGAHPISQAELAKIAGLSERHVRRLEELRRLPPAVEMLLRLAITFETSLDALIDPRHMNRLIREIEQRRAVRRRSSPGA